MIIKNCSSHPVVQSYLRKHQLSARWIGWGYKGSGRFTRWISCLLGKEFHLFEDAPIRSLRPGYHGAVYGITVDKKGAMFDATGESTLIDHLNEGKIKVSAQVLTLMERITCLGISKYNWSLPYSPEDLATFKPGVLLVDQTKGDAALKAARVSAETFQKMVNDALAETPEGMPIYLKTHPDQKHRDKKSCFSPAVFTHPRLTILPAEIRLADAFHFSETVYVASSLAGMEALMHGKKVITYGWNFYAGWGLTEDRGASPLPPRKRTLSLEELFQAYYLDYCYYADPHTLKETNLGSILDHIELQFIGWKKHQGDYHFTAHLSPWHKHVLQKNLTTPTLTFRETPTENSTGLHWGMKGEEENSVVRVEDGFIRSRGLGANFHYPMSLVLDDRGIYFNAEQPSRLEHILNTAQWSPEELAEGSALHRYLVENHITKYLHTPVSQRNLLTDAAQGAKRRGRTIILVPGQVDSDASIKYGSPDFKTNQAFLKHLRHTYPEAFLIFKPHPDLLSRARADAPLWDGIEADCDYIATTGDVISWIKAVDEIHTMTSTVGYEALMHEKPVFTYGLPFYSGWGLTTDALPNTRRTRPCTLNELITGSLITYPIYMNPNNGEYISPLKAAELLNDPSFTLLPPPKALRLLARLKQWRNQWRGAVSGR